jgi:hypothetical protein
MKTYCNSYKMYLKKFSIASWKYSFQCRYLYFQKCIEKHERFLKFCFKRRHISSWLCKIIQNCLKVIVAFQIFIIRTTFQQNKKSNIFVFESPLVSLSSNIQYKIPFWESLYISKQINNWFEKIGAHTRKKKHINYFKN